jgi:hypothetical protein
VIAKLDKDDTVFLILSVLIPLILWWYSTGKKKYDAKGMTR